MLGPDRERAYLAKFDYGNQDSSSGLTTLWLDDSLRISPEEQERFMVRTPIKAAGPSSPPTPHRRCPLRPPRR